MKRITLTLLAGIALLTAGTANAHSSHQAHSATHQVLKKVTTVVSQTLAPSSRATGAKVNVFVNVLPKNHKVKTVGNTHYYVVNNAYYKKSGKRYVMVEVPHGVKHAPKNKKVVVVRESR